MKIAAHTLVKNEERFLWYSVKSVIDYVDWMLLWDTGSGDKTKEIINLLKKEYPEKIKSKFMKIDDLNKFSSIRQSMLETDADSDWIILVDGDEIWWGDRIKEVVDNINQNGNKIETVVSSYYNCVGDLYHHQPENMGKYKIDDEVGHITIRAMNKNIPGLHYSLPHGQQGIFDDNDTLIQQRNLKKRLHLTTQKSYLHMTHLRRSDIKYDNKVYKRTMKYKYNKGISFPLNFYYPEVFFINRPEIVPNIWMNRGNKYEKKAYLLDSLRLIKHVSPLPERSGY